MESIYGLGPTRTNTVDPIKQCEQHVFYHYHIKIYDLNSTLIQEYNGLYDIIVFDDEKITFVDTDEKVHMFYLKNGIVIIDQL